MNQLIVVTGSKGAGKSIAAATVAPPKEAEKMFVVDTENSMSDIVDQVKFGRYIKAYDRLKPDTKMLTSIAGGKMPWVSETERNTLVEYYRWFIDMLDKELKDKQFKYLVIDTAEPIEASFAAAAEAGGKQFGWSGSRAYGRLETEAVRPLYENLLQAIYARGVETILLTTHLKRVWEDNSPIPNAVKPGGRLTVLTRLSTLMLWLVPNVGNEDGAPAALVLKARMGKLVATDKGWETRRILPQRIPHFSWMDVERYRQQPANLANPAPGETPTQAEQNMISEMLTDEQMKLMVVGAEIQLKQMQGGSPMLTAPQIDMHMLEGLKAQNLPPAEIAQRLGAPLPAVLSAIRTNGA